jgi:hypothetical protein
MKSQLRDVPLPWRVYVLSWAWLGIGLGLWSKSVVIMAVVWAVGATVGWLLPDLGAQRSSPRQALAAKRRDELALARAAGLPAVAPGFQLTSLPTTNSMKATVKLVIAQRSEFETFEHLSRLFADNPDVRVSWDRRHGGRRQRRDFRSPERRVADDRRRLSKPWHRLNYFVVHTATAQPLSLR